MPQTAEKLQHLFDTLKALLQSFENPLEGRSETGRDYDLWSVKDMVVEGRPRKELYFAGIRIQKDFVGFYFMPVYTHKEHFETLAPGLLKHLKGKSCFRLKTLDESLAEQIRLALEKGLESYKAFDWV